MRILGVDPGLRRTGFGVIDVRGAKLTYVASGTIVVPSDVTLPLRLKVILDNLRQIVEDTKPDVAALEIVFMNTNPASTLLLGQARGAALCALADRDLAVHEYTALQIKKSVVGAGRAAKEQVQMMVQRLLHLDGVPAPDFCRCARMRHLSRAYRTAHRKTWSNELSDAHVAWPHTRARRQIAGLAPKDSE